MIRPLRALPLLLAALPALGCRTSDPRVPFDRHGGWMATLGEGAHHVGDRYLTNYPSTRLELVTPAAGTGGWNWEVALDHGRRSGYDEQVFGGRFFFDTDGDGTAERWDLSTRLPAKRRFEIQELNVGVRQLYREGCALQPYFGVGGALLRITVEEELSGALHVPEPPAPEGFDFAPKDPHSITHRISLGLYARAGLQWRIFGAPTGRGFGTFLLADVRGMVGTEHSYEAAFVGLGLGW